MEKQYILFDLDGTLTDSMEGITRSVAYALSKYGIEADPAGLTAFIGPPLLDSFQKIYGFDREQALEAVEHYREVFADKGIFQNRVYEGIPEMLAELKKAGKTVILATSKPEPYAVRILEHFDLMKYFDLVCGASMDESLSRKADIIACALKAAAVKDIGEAVMVGDRLHDIAGAKANGLESVGVLYGYGDERELVDAGADVIVRDVKALETVLKGESIMKPESLVIFFPCKSIEETKAYYTEVLGLRLYKEMKDSLWLDCGYGYLAFCYYGPERPMAEGECISFNLPSRSHVDEMYERLRRDGRAFGLQNPPAHHPVFPVYSFFFRDPNGYLLEYQKTDD